MTMTWRWGSSPCAAWWRGAVTSEVAPDVGRLMRWRAPLVWVSLLMLLAAGMGWLAPLFHWVEPGARQVIYPHGDFLVLLGRHLLVVSVASLPMHPPGAGAAVHVTRPACRDILPLGAQSAAIGQTFPPKPALTLALPVLGSGAWPV